MQAEELMQGLIGLQSVAPSAAFPVRPLALHPHTSWPVVHCWPTILVVVAAAQHMIELSFPFSFLDSLLAREVHVYLFSSYRYL